MKKTTSGFTIIELLVVIIVIGILSIMGGSSYYKIQTSTRDSERSSKIAAIASALENYYEENGEYPSCIAMGQSASEISNNLLVGLNADSLKMPKAADNTNSIIQNCGELTAGIDAIAYIGDGTTECLTGQGCSDWLLKYYEESTGNIVSISSKDRSTNATLGLISDLATTYIDFTQINLGWAAITDATNYDIQRASNSGFTVNLNESNTLTNSINITGLTSGNTYYFRVRPNSAIGSGQWSNIISATTLYLLAPTASATNIQLTQITIGWNSVALANSYTIQMSTSSNFTSPTIVTNIVGTSHTFTGLNATYAYYFRVQAVNGTNTSSWSNVVTVPRR